MTDILQWVVIILVGLAGTYNSRSITVLTRVVTGFGTRREAAQALYDKYMRGQRMKKRVYVFAGNYGQAREYARRHELDGSWRHVADKFTLAGIVPRRVEIHLVGSWPSVESAADAYRYLVGQSSLYDVELDDKTIGGGKL